MERIVVVGMKKKRDARRKEGEDWTQAASYTRRSRRRIVRFAKQSKS